MKAPSQRQLRVGEEIRHVLASLLQEGDLRDPLLYDASITVTEVRISPDLKNATAYVMPLGGRTQVEGASVDDVISALNRAAPFFKGRIGRAMHLKYAPSLRFRLDDTFEEADKISSLLERARRDGKVTLDAPEDDDDFDNEGDENGEAR
jgi:ribosome-binding factor A